MLIFFQTTLSKPVENNSNSVDSNEDYPFSPKQTLMLYTGTHFLMLGFKYVDKSVIASKNILKDQDLLDNDKPEILEFKKKLTNFVESFESNKDTDKILEVLEVYGNTVDYYLELPKEKETAETQFIVNILKKYKVKDMDEKFTKEFNKFLEEFKVMFEEAKNDLDKPFLEWYEKFVVIEDVEKKIESFEKFLELFGDKNK